MQKEADVQQAQLEQQSFPMDVQTNGTITHQHTLPEGAIELKPILFPHPKIKSNDTAEQARRIAKDNIDIFFTEVFAATHPEQYSRRYRRDFTILGNEHRQFVPDLTQDNYLGDKHIEIKAVSHRRAQASLGTDQLENYLFHLANDSIARKQDRPVFRYVIFRYGKKPNLKLHSMPEVEAGKTIARNIRDCLILATNQLFPLSLVSRPEERPREEHNSRYFMLGGRLINTLHDKKSVDMDYLLSNYLKSIGCRKNSTPAKRIEAARRYASKPFLHLDDLTVEQFPSDRRGPLVYEGVTLPPFQVTVYSIMNYPQWLDDFRENHSRMIRPLDIRDLFAEDQRYQRRHPKKDGPF